MENASVQRGLFLTFRLLSLIRHALRRATFPGGEGCLPAGAAYTGPGLNFQGSPPHPARATPGPPSPSRRGLEPLIRHALRRATFPVGEGDLRRGSIHRGPVLTFRAPLHTRCLRRHPLQQERAGDFFKNPLLFPRESLIINPKKIPKTFPVLGVSAYLGGH